MGGSFQRCSLLVPPLVTAVWRCPGQGAMGAELGPGIRRRAVAERGRGTPLSSSLSPSLQGPARGRGFRPGADGSAQAQAAGAVLAVGAAKSRELGGSGQGA